jgi:acyl-CoA synthetase (AMP-forming)/AMP-acid ligase II
MAITKGSSELKYGRRLLPHILDHKASTDSEQEAFQLPRSTNPDDGWKSVTFKELANAVNHVARMLLDTFGKPQTSFPTIAYVGPNDARYIVSSVL